MQHKIRYINNGRGGYVVYEHGKKQIKISFEYGFGNSLAIIYVPTSEEWISKTNLPITERQSVLAFVAEQSIKDQAPHGYYDLSETCIEIFSKKAY